MARQGKAEPCKVHDSRVGQGSMQGPYLLHQFVPGWVVELQDNLLAGAHCRELQIQNPDIPVSHEHNLGGVHPRARWMQGYP